MLRHEGDEKLENVLDVVVLMHSVEEVEHRLKFVVENSVAFEDQLLDVEEDESAKSQDFISRWSGTVETLIQRMMGEKGEEWKEMIK